VEIATGKSDNFSPETKQSKTANYWINLDYEKKKQYYF